MSWCSWFANVYNIDFRSGTYHEKSFLIDPKVARTIAEAIETHSERGPDTKFIDADGGLCMVTKEVMERDLFPATNGHLVFEKDTHFQVLNRRASGTTPFTNILKQIFVTIFCNV